MNPSTTESRARARRYTVEEWEVQKLTIEKLYVKEEKPLKEVIGLLEQNFGFVATYDFSPTGCLAPQLTYYQ
jgi:hypothetical protein